MKKLLTILSFLFCTAAFGQRLQDLPSYVPPNINSLYAPVFFETYPGSGIWLPARKALLTDLLKQKLDSAKVINGSLYTYSNGIGSNVGSAGASLANSDSLVEGPTHLFFTNARVRAALINGWGLNYDVYNNLGRYAVDSNLTGTLYKIYKVRDSLAAAKLNNSGWASNRVFYSDGSGNAATNSLYSYNGVGLGIGIGDAIEKLHIEGGNLLVSAATSGSHTNYFSGPLVKVAFQDSWPIGLGLYAGEGLDDVGPALYARYGSNVSPVMYFRGHDGAMFLPGFAYTGAYAGDSARVMVINPNSQVTPSSVSLSKIPQINSSGQLSPGAVASGTPREGDRPIVRSGVLTYGSENTFLKNLGTYPLLIPIGTDTVGVNSITISSADSSITVTPTTGSGNINFDVSTTESDPTVPAAVKALDPTQLVTKTGPASLVNKTVVPRTYQGSSVTTLAIDASVYDAYDLTAQNGNITVSNPTNTLFNMQRIWLRIYGTGSQGTITWGDKFSGTLPSSTIVGDFVISGFLYNQTLDKWQCVTDNSLPTTVMVTNQNNTVLPGYKVTLGGSAVTAGLGFAGTSAPPTGRIDHDFWFSTTLNQFQYRANGYDRTMMNTDEAQTVSNKRNLLRDTVLSATTFSGGFTPDLSVKSSYNFSAISAALTINAPIGTPKAKEAILFYIKDNGTAQTITWGAGYRGSSDIALPTTTTAGKGMYVGFVVNSIDGGYDLVTLINGFAALN